jgi:hypothetical protein
MRGPLAAIARSDKSRTVRLVLDGITPPEQEDSVTVRVFLNCRNPGADTPITDPTYVTSCTFFGTRHAAHHGDGRVSFGFDVAPVVRRLNANNVYEPNGPLDVAIVVVPRRPALADAARRAAIQPQRVRLELF